MKFDFAIRPKKKLRLFRLKIKKNFFLSFIGEIKNAAWIFHTSPHKLSKGLKLISSNCRRRILRRDLWSPEQIACRLREMKPAANLPPCAAPALAVSPETIYGAIYAMPRGTLRSELVELLFVRATRRGFLAPEGLSARRACPI